MQVQQFKGFQEYRNRVCLAEAVTLEEGIDDSLRADQRSGV